MAAAVKKRIWLWSALVLGLIVAAIGFGIAQHLTGEALERASSRLQLLNALRKQALIEYFETAKTELTFWSINEDILSKQTEMVKRWRAYADRHGDPGARLHQIYVEANPFDAGQRAQLSDAGDGSRYSELHAELHPLARRFVVERGYYDFFLIGPDGNVFYTVEKEADFGTNLLTGRWHDTGLAEVFRRAREAADSQDVAFSDLSPYEPSNGEPAMFMARAMKNDEGELLGVLAFQLPVDRIRAIMQFHAGMGDSGETYLVGEDRLMRSDSRFSQASTALKVSVETQAVQRALDGDRGTMIMPDYRGVPVLSAYDRVGVDRYRWAILAEIDEVEVLHDAAEAYPQISGLMLLLYALGLGSVWFLRLDDLPQVEDAGMAAQSDTDFPDMQA